MILRLSHSEIRAILSIISLFLCCMSLSMAQESDRTMKLRLAQGFEQANDWEHALPLYEELYRSEPNNFTFVNGLQRGYTQFKEYEKAIRVVRQWLSRQSEDIQMLTTLGGLYFDSGNEFAADSVWQKVLSIDPNNVHSYNIVANEMMEHRLYDQCIRMYLKGRSLGDNGALFADELGTLYAALQQYDSATQEYLRLLTASPNQLSLIQSRLRTYTSKAEAMRVTSETVGAEVKRQPENIPLRRLYAWLLMEFRDYDLALVQYRIIDRLANANGNELYNFAQRLSQEHASKTAAEAFKEVIDGQKNPSILPQARLGYTRALEDLCAQTDTISNKTQSQVSYQYVIQLYESLVSSHPLPNLTLEALYRIGIIKFEKLYDLDGALEAFNRIKKLSITSNTSHDASLRIGEVQVARNHLGEARKEYESVRRVPIPVYQDQAIFKLAELCYYEAQFDSARALLSRFRANLTTDAANDALQLQYFIQENETASRNALAEYSIADLLVRQRKFSEALIRFQNIVKRYPTALLVDDAVFKIGEIYLQLGQPGEALSEFHFLVDSVETSILKDRSQFRIAEIYHSVLGNRAQAIEAYEKLLAQFPNSLYAEETRKRIRILRGDVL